MKNTKALFYFISSSLLLACSTSSNPSPPNTVPPDYYTGTIVDIKKTGPSYYFLSVVPGLTDTIETILTITDTDLQNEIPNLLGDDILFGLNTYESVSSRGTYNRVGGCWWIPSSSIPRMVNFYKMPNLFFPCAEGTVYDLEFISSSNDTIEYYEFSSALTCGDTVSESIFFNTNLTTPTSILNEKIVYQVTFGNGRFRWNWELPNY